MSSQAKPAGSAQAMGASGQFWSNASNINGVSQTSGAFPGSGYASVGPFRLGISLTSNWLACFNNGFSIPSGATINGFVLTAYVYASSVADGLKVYGGLNTITTTSGNSSTWNANCVSKTSSAITHGTATLITLGSSSDLWGLSSPTYSQVNSTTAFSFGLCAGNPSSVGTTKEANWNLYLSSLILTVYYTTSSTYIPGNFFF